MAELDLPIRRPLSSRQLLGEGHASVVAAFAQAPHPQDERVRVVVGLVHIRTTVMGKQALMMI
jgi:hypothetical protein